jgi:hypothetical protein
MPETPQRREYRIQYYGTPEQKLKKRLYYAEYYQRPGAQELMRARRNSPEGREKQHIYNLRRKAKLAAMRELKTEAQPTTT